MPAEFTNCVADLKKQGKSEDSAYAICVSDYMKKHGKSPFKSESEIEKLPVSKSLKETLKDALAHPQSTRLQTTVLEGIGEGKKMKVVRS